MSEKKPKKREWDVGKDAHGRPVTLVNERNYDGKDMWSIVSAAVNQRDDGERIYALSLETLKAIAGIIGKEPG